MDTKSMVSTMEPIVVEQELSTPNGSMQLHVAGYMKGKKVIDQKGDSLMGFLLWVMWMKFRGETHIDDANPGGAIPIKVYANGPEPTNITSIMRHNSFPNTGMIEVIVARSLFNSDEISPKAQFFGLTTYADDLNGQVKDIIVIDDCTAVVPDVAHTVNESSSDGMIYSGSGTRDNTMAHIPNKDHTYIGVGTGNYTVRLTQLGLIEYLDKVNYTMETLYSAYPGKIMLKGRYHNSSESSVYINEVAILSGISSNTSNPDAVTTMVARDGIYPVEVPSRENLDIEYTIKIGPVSGQNNGGFTMQFAKLVSGILGVQSVNVVNLLGSTLPMQPTDTWPVGIVVGSGTTAISENDNNMAIPIQDGAGTGMLTHYPARLVTYVNDSPTTWIAKIDQLFANDGDFEITVREVGLVGANILIARNILQSSTTVPSGYVLKVSYVIRFQT